jgi:hypothetical protein
LNNIGGYEDTATGASAMAQNTTGFWNTAVGYTAMQGNTTGNYNTAVGYNAMGTNTTGSSNTVIGVDANATGSSSIAIGYQAGSNIANGNSGNITIGNLGAAGDSYTTRIGTQATASTTYIAGIYGASSSGGAPVYVNVNGQLGTVLSSQRFKEQIADMGDTSSKLFQLRPVNFFYKPKYDDGSRLLQYGLIAEEVEKVYPEMIAYDNDGQIMTVKYQMLTPMLLNEVQKQHAEIQNQKEENRKLADRLAAIEAVLASQAPTIAQPPTAQ